jgi:Type II CAAX prenyl endopeptidase Rce1-like
MAVAYAALLMDTNQDGTPPPLRLVTATSPADEAWLAESEAATAERRAAAEAVGGAMRRGLARWTILLTAGSLVTLIIGHLEGSLLMAVAGLFALTQSWDVRDRARTGDPDSDRALAPGTVGRVLRFLVPLVVPFTGALLFAGIAAYGRMLGTAAGTGATRWSVSAACVCLFAALPPIQHQLALAFTRGPWPGHTARLTATTALVLLLLPVPAQLLLPELTAMMRASSEPLVQVSGLVGQLIGLVVFALAAVGLWVGRSWSETLDRLGLHALTPLHSLIALVALAAVFGVNAGLEWVERTRFVELWRQDQEMVRLMAGHLGLAGAIVLGISAGVGEEVLVRGALQPRVGMVWAALLFAAGHIQYTWFGMLTVFGLGLVFGIVRRVSNTTVAVIVHAAYDVLAVLATR